MRITIIAVLMVISGLCFADGGPVTGNKIKIVCNKDAPNQAACLMFTVGVEQTLFYISLRQYKDNFKSGFEKAFGYCPFQGQTGEQQALIFIKYLDDHPEQLHLPATALFVMAMDNAFPPPCN